MISIKFREDEAKKAPIGVSISGVRLETLCVTPNRTFQGTSVSAVNPAGVDRGLGREGGRAGVDLALRPHYSTGTSVTNVVLTAQMAKPSGNSPRFALGTASGIPPRGRPVFRA